MPDRNLCAAEKPLVEIKIVHANLPGDEVGMTEYY
jgi:hypothetical protein